jgi:hypothetical protein
MGLGTCMQSLQEETSSIAKDMESLKILMSSLNHHVSVPPSSRQSPLTCYQKHVMNAANSMEQMNKVGDNDIASFAPGAMQANIRQHGILSRQIGRVNRTSCTCRSRPGRVSYLRWPIDISWDTRSGHNPGCPYTTFSPTVTDINMRFSLCGFGLRRKIEISIAISHMAHGSFSINPALTCYRTVPKSSPAFELMRNYNRCPERIPGELFKLFQDGKASPYDRLEDGTTLLHVRCRNTWSSNQWNPLFMVYLCRLISLLELL